MVALGAVLNIHASGPSLSRRARRTWVGTFLVLGLALIYASARDSAERRADRTTFGNQLAGISHTVSQISAGSLRAKMFALSTQLQIWVAQQELLPADSYNVPFPDGSGAYSVDRRAEPYNDLFLPHVSELAKEAVDKGYIPPDAIHTGRVNQLSDIRGIA